MQSSSSAAGSADVPDGKKRRFPDNHFGAVTAAVQQYKEQGYPTFKAAAAATAADFAKFNSGKPGAHKNIQASSSRWQRGNCRQPAVCTLHDSMLPQQLASAILARAHRPANVSCTDWASTADLEPHIAWGRLAVRCCSQPCYFGSAKHCAHFGSAKKACFLAWAAPGMAIGHLNGQGCLLLQTVPELVAALTKSLTDSNCDMAYWTEKRITETIKGRFKNSRRAGGCPRTRAPRSCCFILADSTRHYLLQHRTRTRHRWQQRQRQRQQQR